MKLIDLEKRIWGLLPRELREVDHLLIGVHWGCSFVLHCMVEYFVLLVVFQFWQIDVKIYKF